MTRENAILNRHAVRADQRVRRSPPVIKSGLPGEGIYRLFGKEHETSRIRRNNPLQGSSSNTASRVSPGMLQGWSPKPGGFGGDARLPNGWSRWFPISIGIRILLRFTRAEMVTTELALQSVPNYRSLRKRGITVRKTIDSLVATFCMEHGHELLHNDHDYDAYEKHLGLSVIRP